MHETFRFDMQKEKLIYMYLCKEKLKKKQMKKLEGEKKFVSYVSWRDYIVEKYEGYDESCLIELDKMLNLLIRNSEKFDNYNQCVWTAYLSTMISVFMTQTITSLQDGMLALGVWIICMPFILGMLIAKVYNGYGSESIAIYFLKDIQEIVQCLINEKGMCKKE